MKTSTVHLNLPDFMAQGENTNVLVLGPLAKGKHRVSIFTQFVAVVTVRGWKETTVMHIERSDGLKWITVISFNKVFDCMNAPKGKDCRLLFDEYRDIVLPKSSCIRIRFERMYRNKQTLAMLKAPAIEINSIKES